MNYPIAASELARDGKACIRNSARAIILRDNKVLAIKLVDEDGFWYVLPGGGQDHSETLHEALKRECLEEVGAEVEVGDLWFVREYIGGHHEFAVSHAGFHSIEFMFQCHLAEGAEVGNGTEPDPGQLELVWLDVAELDRYRLYPLALRPLIMHHTESTPVYLGDVN